MFTKSMFSIAFALASFSLCVEGVKMAGSKIHPMHFALADIDARNGLARATVGCFSEFSINQANTVKKMGEAWELCGDSEIRSNEQLDDDLRRFSNEIARIPNDICVKIDDECRDKFAQDGDVLAALECYATVPISMRSKILKMAEDCKVRALTADTESKTILATRKNCTYNANVEYLQTSDSLFGKLVTTCDNSPSGPESTTALFTTQSTTLSPITPTTPEVVPSTPAEPSTADESTTKRGRFPWN